MKKVLIRVAVILCAAALIVFAAEKITEAGARFIPSYEKVSLADYSGKKAGDFSEEDYAVLLRQTGLGKAAVDGIFAAEADPGRVLEFYQEKFFDPPPYTCYKIGIGTREERFLDEEGNPVYGFDIADVKVGDIVISKCTHSVGWRHGHAGIVIDAKNGKTFEAIYPGTLTMVQDLSKWRTYPQFILLRLKEPGLGEKAAAIAVEDLTGIYWLHYAGIFDRNSEKPKATQCSHLIWHAYLRLGYDLDSDGIWPVTPKNIVNSEYVEIVQIYGVDPDRIWK